MTEKNILDKIRAECNASAPDNFSEIENQIMSLKKRRRNIIFKISAAAAVIAIPFLSVIASQKYKPMGPEDIKLAEVTVDTSESDYPSETHNTQATTKPVSENKTEKSTVTASPVESQSVQSTENGVKTQLQIDSHTISKKQTEYAPSKNTSQADTTAMTTNKVDSDISDKPHTNISYCISETKKTIASSENDDTDLPHDQDFTYSDPCLTVPHESNVSNTTQAYTDVPVLTPPIELTSKCTGIQQPLSIKVIYNDLSKDDYGKLKTKIYDGRYYYYVVADFELYTVELQYSEHSEKLSIDQVLAGKGLTIEDLVEAGLPAVKFEK